MKTPLRSLTCLILLGLAACTGGSSGGGTTPSGPTPPPPPPPTTYTIGGTVSGLSSGAKVSVLDNGGDSLTVSTNGTFTFTTGLASGAAYAVTVSTQPSGETCAPSSATGTVAASNVTNVTIICTVTATPYTVGGTVSGLSGGAEVTIQLNGGDNFTATNGGFSFTKTLLSGAAYVVSILTQPSRETCALSNASGTIGSADITNVLVGCTAGGGGGTGGAFWLPFAAAPMTGTTGGQTGLFLIASTTIAETPAPTPSWVTTNAPTLLGLAVAGFVSGGTLPTSETPALMIYAAAGPDGNTHLYGLNLAYRSSTPPVPTQITDVSVPPSQNVCNAGQMEADGATPTSLAVVFYVVTPTAGAKPGTEGYCPAGGTYELAHYTDGATATPTIVNIQGGTSNFSALLNDGPFNSIYQNNGDLAGVVLWDAADQDLNLYANESFVAPTPLLSGVTEPIAIFSRTVEYGASTLGGGNYLFSTSTGTATAAYRVDSSLTATQFFAGSVSGAVADDNNLYFVGSPGSSTTQAIYKEPLSFAGSATLLSSALPTPSGTGGSELIWSNDSVLIFENYSISGAGSASYSLLSVPVGATSTSATTIAGPFTGDLAESFMASPTGTDTAADILFLTTINQTNSGGGLKVSYSSQVLSAAGSVKQASAANTFMGSFGTLTTELDGDVWEIQGITDTSGGYGGGTIDELNVGTLAKTALTTTGGAGYAIPTGYAMSLIGFYGTNIAVGGFVPVASQKGNSIGAAVDVSQHCILPISLSNTNGAPLL